MIGRAVVLVRLIVVAVAAPVVRSVRFVVCAGIVATVVLICILRLHTPDGVDDGTRRGRQVPVVVRTATHNPGTEAVDRTVPEQTAAAVASAPLVASLVSVAGVHLRHLCFYLLYLSSNIIMLPILLEPLIMRSVP